MSPAFYPGYPYNILRLFAGLPWNFLGVPMLSPGHLGLTRFPNVFKVSSEILNINNFGYYQQHAKGSPRSPQGHLQVSHCNYYRGSPVSPHLSQGYSICIPIRSIQAHSRSPKVSLDLPRLSLDLPTVFQVSPRLP